MAWVDWYTSKRFGKRWRVRERTGENKIVTLKTGIPTKKLANDWMMDNDRGMFTEENDLPDRERNFKDVMQDFLLYTEKSGKSKNTQIQYRYSLKSAADALGAVSEIPLVRLKTFHMERMKEDLLNGEVRGPNHKSARPRSINGVKIILRTVKVLFSYAVRMGYMARNIAKGVDNLRGVDVHHRITDEEARLVLGECLDIELWEICMIAWKTGMRENEIVQKLNVERISNNIIHFNPGETKRNRAGRIVPITEDIKFILDRAANAKKGRLYPGWSLNRLKLSWSRLVKRVNRRLRQMGEPQIARLRFHDWKHTFISNWLSDGGKLLEVRQIVGNSLVSLQNYAHFEQSEVVEVANRIMQKRAGIRPRLVEQKVEQSLGDDPAISGNIKTSGLVSIRPFTVNKAAV